jgi:hypothetical protein
MQLRAHPGEGYTRQKVVSGNKAVGTLPTRAAQININRDGCVAVRVIAPNFGGVLVDNAPTIGLRMTGVMFTMISMAAKVSTVR